MYNYLLIMLITKPILYSPPLFLTVSQSTDSKSKYFEIKVNKVTSGNFFSTYSYF